MSELTIEANICEINNGPYYPVKLHTVPRVGELINFFSFKDQADNYPPSKHYEVVQVIYKISDESDKVPGSKGGPQSISVLVKQTTNKYFR